MYIYILDYMQIKRCVPIVYTNIIDGTSGKSPSQTIDILDSGVLRGVERAQKANV